MSESENIRPMGTMVRKYTRPVIGTFFRESSIVVQRAMSCVINVANSMCHVVRKIGYSNFAVAMMYLLKRITLEDRVIHVLVMRSARTEFSVVQLVMLPLTLRRQLDEETP